MLLRPAIIISAVIVFSTLNGWALINGLKHNNLWSSLMAMLAIGGTFYFVHIYQKLLSTPAEELENEVTNRTDNP